MEVDRGHDPRGSAGGSEFWLTRFLVLWFLGFVYFFAFLAAATQALPLLGSDGLMPVTIWMRAVEHALGSRFEGFLEFPSLFWMGASNGALVWVAWLGAGLSLLVLAGFANAFLLGALWVLYMSFVHVGQEWY